MYIVTYEHRHGLDVWAAENETTAEYTVMNTILNWITDLDQDDAEKVINLLSNKKFQEARQMWAEKNNEFFDIIYVDPKLNMNTLEGAKSEFEEQLKDAKKLYEIRDAKKDT